MRKGEEEKYVKKRERESEVREKEGDREFESLRV